MKRKYTMTDKRLAEDVKKADWKKRLEYLTLYNQGWSVRKLAVANNVSTQFVYATLAKMKNVTVEEAEKYAK